MNTETDIKRQLSQLKGKSEREIMKLMSAWSKNGQADNFTKEDHAKIAEALNYAIAHDNRSREEMLYEELGEYKR